MNIVSFSTLSLLKPNILKAVPEQIKAKQQRALKWSGFLVFSFSQGEREKLPAETMEFLTKMQENEERKEGGLPGSSPSL